MTGRRWLVLLLVALNVFDAVASLTLLRAGANEANPLLVALASAPALFVAVKAAWSFGLGFLLGWLHNAGSKLAAPGLVACVVAYAALAGYHAALFVTR